MTFLLTLAICLVSGANALAAVVLLVNRASATTRCILSQPGEKAVDVAIKKGDLLPVVIGEKMEIAFYSGKADRRYALQADSIYVFGMAGEELVLQHVGLRPAEVNPAAAVLTDASTEVKKSAEQLAEDAKRSSQLLTVAVKVLVDDDEQANRRSWETRLKKRIEAISDVLEHTCRVRLSVLETDTWISNNSITEFESSVDEFTRKVDPGKARLAIGFSSQYQVPQGKFNLGGTRGALGRHILIREWSQHVTEEERIEVLLHEVGHFLGAAHSFERDSVMRPVLGDRQARARDFRIGFDPLNALAMNLVADELRVRDYGSLSQLSLPTRNKLRQLYNEIGATLPNDPAPPEYLRLLGFNLDRSATLLPSAPYPFPTSRSARP